MDKILEKELEETKGERDTIREELDLQREAFALKITKGLGESIKKNQPATLTKAEKKMIRNQRHNTFWNKIKTIFVGGKKEWYQDLTNL